jgi:hypothetical protein
LVGTSWLVVQVASLPAASWLVLGVPLSAASWLVVQVSWLVLGASLPAAIKGTVAPGSYYAGWW